AQRAGGVEHLSAGPGGVIALGVAGGDVVGGGVAQDHFAGSFGGEVLAHPGDHHGQFGLVVDFLGVGRQHDRVVGAHHGGVGFDEQQGLLGHLMAEFGGVLAVIAAHADHFGARDDRRQE